MDVPPSALNHLIIEDFSFFLFLRQQTGRDEVEGEEERGGGGVGHHDDHPEPDNDSTPVT